MALSQKHIAHCIDKHRHSTTSSKLHGQFNLHSRPTSGSVADIVWMQARILVPAKLCAYSCLLQRICKGVAQGLVASTEEYKFSGLCASVYRHRGRMPAHQRNTVGVVKFVAGDMQVRGAWSEPGAKAVQAEVRAGNAFGNGVCVVLQAPAVWRQYGEI